MRRFTQALTDVSHFHVGGLGREAGSEDVVKQKMILIDKRGIINPSRDYTEKLTTLTQAWELGLDVSTAGNSHITIISIHRHWDFFFS